MTYLPSKREGVSGLVVKFVVAIDEPGVRFPPNAVLFAGSIQKFLLISGVKVSRIIQSHGT